MRSEIKVFAKNGFTDINEVRRHVLPLSEYKPLSDLATTSPAPEKAEYVIKKAEEYLTATIPMLPLSLFREHFTKDIRANYSNNFNFRRDMLYYMTLAEIAERKGRFVEKIADIIWAILEESTWSIPPHIGRSMGASPSDPYTEIADVYDEKWISALDLQCSQTCAALAVASYYLRDELDSVTPVIRQRLNYMVTLRGIRPFIVSTFGWSGLYRSGIICNWLTNITCNVLYAGALILEDKEKRERVALRAMNILDAFTAGYPLDGTCDEGPSYWGAAAGNYFDALEIIEEMSGGKFTVYHEPIVRNMGEFITKLNIHDATFAAFADTSTSVICHSGDMMHRFGKKTGSLPLESYGKYRAKEGFDTYYFYGMASRWLKNYYSPVVTEAEMPKALLSVWMEGHKIAVFREFADTSRGLFLAIKGGSNGEPGNHNDVGCIVVYSNTKPVIVDPGIGSYNHDYFGATRYLRWFTNASYHSCPTIDGIEQQNGVNFASKCEVCDVEHKTLTMDIGGAYPAMAGVLSLVRTTSLADGKISVTDDVKLDHEGDIELHFLSVQEPKVVGEGKLELADGRIFSFDKDLALRLDRVENTRLPYEDLNIQAKWGVPCLWRISLSKHASELCAKITIS